MWPATTVSLALLLPAAKKPPPPPRAAAPRAQIRHRLAGAVHLLSATTILVYGLVERPLADYSLNIAHGGERVVWQQACYRNGSYASGGAGCPAGRRAFYAEGLRGQSADSVLPFNVLLWAFVFAAWSGALHQVVAFRLPGADDPARLQMRARWFDYAVSAPLMLAVVGASFGAANTHAVLAAPLGLFVLLVAAGVIELGGAAAGTGAAGGKAAAGPPWRRPGALIGFCVLIWLYSYVWDPVASALARSRAGPEGGRPPDAVAAMLLAIVVVFTSFAAVYAYDLARGGPATEQAYLFLSMFSKVLLHSFLGIAVLQQRAMLQSRMPTHGRPPRPLSLAAVAVATGGTLALSLLVHFAGPHAARACGHRDQ